MSRPEFVFSIETELGYNNRKNIHVLEIRTLIAVKIGGDTSKKLIAEFAPGVSVMNGEICFSNNSGIVLTS